MNIIKDAWEQAQERDSVLDSTELFMLKYAPYFADYEPLYLDWYNKIDDMESPLKMILVHPGAGKSTRLKWEALRRICKRRSYKIAYISKASSKAALFMKSIAKELKENKDIIRDFGTFWEYGAQWNTEGIRVSGSGSDATPSISNYGVTTQIEGMRPDFIIVDDPVDIHTARSPAENDAMRDIFPTWIERLHIGSESEMWIIGHRFDPHDFYRHIELEYDKSFDILVLPAYDEETLTPLVHEFWDYDTLKRKILGVHNNYSIEAHYQQKLIAMEDCPLLWEWLENRVVESVPEDDRITAVVDPAYTKDKKSDYSTAAAGMPFNGGILVTGLQHWRINSGWESIFINFAEEHDAKEIYIEINNAQTLEVSMREHAMDIGSRVSVRGFKSTENKNVRLGSLENPARSGKIWFTKEVTESRPFQDFKAQWTAFPNLSHDDLLDAIEMLYSKIKKGTGTGVVFVDTSRLFG